MSTTTKKLKKSDPSTLAALQVIFNPENVISCKAYGGGSHCNAERTQKKIELWGPRGDDQNSPLQCYLIFKNSQPAAMINLGVTGNPPTVIDRNHHNGNVLELSGIMVRDQYLKPTGDKYSVDKEVVKAAVELLESHHAPGYTKVVATFRDYHPYQADFYKAAGAIKLTAKVAKVILGENAFHPERFKFEGKHLKECTKWDSTQAKVSHDGWHDSGPCIDWDTVNGVVFNINSVGDVVTALDEL